MEMIRHLEADHGYDSRADCTLVGMSDALQVGERPVLTVADMRARQLARRRLHVGKPKVSKNIPGRMLCVRRWYFRESSGVRCDSLC